MVTGSGIGQVRLGRRGAGRWLPFSCSAQPAEQSLDRASGSSDVPHDGNSGLAVVLACGRRIEVRRGFDVGALEQLVRVLERV
jgi:hypothetical protein